MATITVVGASGYVGGRLIPQLVAQGHSVRALTRSKPRLIGYPWIDQVDIVEADLLQPDALASALAGSDAAFYLAHSLEDDDNFVETEQRAARNFADAASAAGLRRIVFLGGLGEGHLSEHLASRQAVGRTLASTGITVIEMRAAVIIGSGSLSFEMLRYLTEVLPVMTTPRWVRTRCQPIAIADVITLLMRGLAADLEGHQIIEIGGPDVVTYEQMMHAYAAAAGLRTRLILRVPMLSPGLSARWIGLVTPLTTNIGRHLVKSLRNEVVVRDPAPMRRLGVESTSLDAALGEALRSTRELDVATRWSASGWRPADPLPSDPDYASGTVFRDRRVVTTSAPTDDVFWAYSRIGGDVGYYRFNWAWKLRGWLDQLVGGVGLRRGRRHPEELRVGESVDFWRVEALEAGKRLALHAEMKLPGEAWLEWVVGANDRGSTLTQTAYFIPRGLLGRMYWYAVSPFHVFVFPKTAQAIASTAERKERS